MTDFATLVLAADTRQLTQAQRAIDDVAKSGERAEKQTDNTSRAIDNMNKMARRAAIGAGALVAATIALTRSSMNQIDAIAKQARQVGLLTRDFQAMSLVAEEAGVSTSNLTNTIGLMQRNIVELGRGTALQTKAFAALGLSIKDLQGLSPDQQFERIAVALADVEDPAQKTALAMEVLGRSGRQAITMLDGYSDALADARRFQEAFGISVSQDASDAIERANDALGRVSMGFQGLGNILATELAPRLEKFANGIIDAIIQTDAINKVAGVLVGILDRAVFVLGAAATAFGIYKAAAILSSVATMGFAAALGVVRVALIKLGIGALVVGAGELAFRFSRLVEGAGGFGTAMGLMRDVVAEVFNRIGDAARGMFNILSGAAKGISAAFVGAFAFIGEKFDTLINGMSVPFNDLMESIGFDVRLGMSSIGDSLRGVEEGLKSAALESIATGAALLDASRQPLESIIALRLATEDVSETAEDGASAGKRLAEALSRSGGVSGSAGAAASAIKSLRDEIDQLNLDADPVAKYNDEIDRLNKLSALGLSEDALAQAIASANDELANSIPMLNDFTSAFENVLNGSVKTFKDFAQTIFQSFRNLMAQLVATAARNRIMISLGMGGSVAGTAASAATSGMGGAIAGAGGMAGLGSAALGGAQFVASGFASGGLAGAGSALATAASGATMGIGGAAAAIGAVALPLLAVAAVVTFFRTKTKELDSGLNVTVKNMDTLVQSFRTVQKSRFWGLSKRVSTTIEDASDGIANPIIDAVSAMQESAINAAAALGVSANAFAGFSHEFNLSLKGLNEQQAMQKVSEELGKMGDAFASLVPGVQSLNELLQVAEQRFQLENRLMQLQGNEAELLVRMREREMNATHALNQSLLSQIHAIEDAQRAAQQQLANAQQAQQAAQQQLANAQQAVTNAFAGLRRAIDAEKDSLRDGFTNVIDAISKRLKLANEAAKTSENIFSALNRALRDRRGQNLSDAMFAQRRVSALAFLQSQQGMQVTDEAALNDALGVVAEPSAKLFRNFTDYQRDFAKTTMLIDELQSVAEFQLSADERAVVLLEEQRALAESQFETQMLKLDNQLASLASQHNALLGIDDSVKTVADAVQALNGALGALGAAQVNNNAVKSAEDKRLTLADAIEKYKTDKNFNFLNLSGGDSKLLELANLAGVSTAGRTGQNIAEDLASATQMILQVDKATRAKRFAAGGVHDGGMRIVGERGPELEMTGPSQIFSHADTMKMMSNAPIVLELRKLQREIEQMRQEQLQLGIQTASSTDRSYRLLRSWNVIGLPEERTA